MPDFSGAEDVLYGTVKRVLDTLPEKIPVYWPGKDASVEPDANQPYIVVVNNPVTNMPETLGRQAIWRSEGNLLIRIIIKESIGEYEKWRDRAQQLTRAFQGRAQGDGVYVMDVRRSSTNVLSGRYSIDVLVTYYFRDSTNVRRGA